MASKFTFIVNMPDQDPSRHDLEGEKITFGRGPDNDIQVLVSEVSVKHGEFVAEGEGFKIVDNGSTNGTKVNGVKIDSSGKGLEAMDKVLLGETIDCYFVATAVLEASEMSELIKDIDAKATKTGTAPVAVAAPVGGGAAPAPVKPVPVTPGGAKPAPVAPGAAKPTPVQPATPNPGAATVKLDQVRPPAGGGPAQPPKPAVPGGVKPPTAAPAPPAGAKPPAPGGVPAPQPVSPTPLKRPDAPSGPAAPPKIPLPGKKAEEES